MSRTNAWIQLYLQALRADPRFSGSREVVPLWLARAGEREPAGEQALWPPRAARVTIQMAAEIWPRLMLAGPAGAGKTTLLRQLACGLAEAILAEDAGEPASATSGRAKSPLPLPLYIELACFQHSVEATFAAGFGPEAPSLQELAQQRPLLVLLDGLDEVAPDMQLISLSALSHTLAALGPQARWICTCRSERLALFRPWLGTAEVREIRALQPRDALGLIQRRHGDELAGWLQRAEDLAELAACPRWLAALPGGIAHELGPTGPLSRGRLLAAWLPAVIAAALEAHRSPATAEAALAALPELAAALDRDRRGSLSIAEALAAIGARDSPTPDMAPGLLQLLVGAGILALDPERQQVSFRRPALRAFGQALLLARASPETWPAGSFARASGDAVVLAYSLCGDRESVLRRLLANGAVSLAARCLIDAEAPGQFEPLLARIGALTPPLRVMLADAFAAEGLSAAALEQLERAALDGYDEAGLFGRLGELYGAAGQWRHARAAYEQALAREAGDLRYRQELGVVCSRLGEMDQAAVALEAVVQAQQHRLSEAAYELGQVYLRQGQAERALSAYRQALAGRPDDPAYQRSVASALRLSGQADEAEALLHALLDEHGDDAAAYAELGRLYGGAGRLAEAIACYLKAAAIEPARPELYREVGRLRRALGDCSGARAALQRAAELDTGSAALSFELGEACELCGEQSGALAAYRHAVRLDPLNDAYQHRLGALLRDRGDDEEAQLVLRAALGLRPDSAAAHADIAELLWRQGQHEPALESYRRALALDPHSADYERALGRAHRELGQLRPAARHLRRAATLAPARAELHYDAGTVAEAAGQIEPALAAYERAAALDPGRAEFARAAGAMRLRLGDRAQARRHLARALRSDRRNAAALYQAGLAHVADASWGRAIRALGRSLRLERTAPAYEALGRALALAGRLDEALAAFAQALQIQPDDPQTLFHYSEALGACGQIEAAYQAARQSARLAAALPAHQQHAGELALRLGRPHEALELFDRALARDSTLVGAHLGRGRVLLELEQPQSALSSAQAALQLAPDLADAALIAGQALVQLGSDDQALPLLARAAALAPTDAAFAALRDLLDRAGQPADALRAAREALALAPDCARHHLRLAELLLGAGDPGAAAEPLQRALQIDPSLAEAHAQLSRIYAQSQDWGQARACAERAVALAPQVAAHRVTLARALSGAGDHAGAILHLGAAAEREPARAEWHYALGQAHVDAGGHAAALACLRRAALLDAGNAEHHSALGRCLHALGEHAGAAEAIEHALRLRPDAALWRAELAQIQIERGWHAEALAELNHAIAASPGHHQLWRLRAGLHLELRQLEATRGDLAEALRRGPDDAASFALLSQLLASGGVYKDALAAAERAVDLQPTAKHRYLLAIALCGLDRRAESAGQLARALAEGGPDGWWAELADDYEALDRHEDARSAWPRAVAAMPEDATLRYRYGCLLAQLGERAGALAQLQQAIARAPQLAPAHARLAELLLEWPEAVPSEPFESPARESAVESARRAVALQPHQSDHWRILGEALLAQGAPDESLQALRRAHELDPANARAAFLLGSASLERGAVEAAVAALTAATAAAPDVAAYHGALGRAYRHNVPLVDEPDELHVAAESTRPALDRARAAFERAVALEPGSLRWRYELGLADQLLCRHAAAVESFDRCLAAPSAGEVGLTPRQAIRGVAQQEHVAPADILRRRALSLYLLGRPAEARADLDTAREQGVAAAADSYLLGRIAYELGDLSAAHAALVAAAGAEPDNPRMQLLLGRVLGALDRSPEAVVAVERATELRPDHAPTLAALSAAYTSLGRHERALAAAVRAVRLDPSVAAYHQRLATLYAHGGRLNEARAALINATTLQPGVAAWHAQMGEICLRLGMSDAARSAHARAAQFDPTNVDYLYAYARLLAGQGLATEARAALEQALQLAPDRGEWHYQLGQLAGQLGDQRGGLDHFAAAVQLAPGVAEHWRTLAHAQRRHSSCEIALETLERALDRFGDDAQLHAAAGALLEQGQRHDQAAWHYRRAVAPDSGIAEHWWRLGRACLALGELAEARGSFERALTLDPRAAAAHAGMAQILAREADVEAVLRHIQRAAELAPDEVDYQMAYAEALAHARHFDAAHRVMERAVRLAPDDPEVQIRYGETALDVGLNREALAAFERAAELQPEQARYHFLAGKAHRRLKQYSRAIERYRRAVRLSPGYSEAIVELSTLGPLAFVAHHLRGADQEVLA